MKNIIIGISCFSFIVNLHSMDNADKSGVSSGESPIINKVYDVKPAIDSDELSDTNSDIDSDESSDTNSDIDFDEFSDDDEDDGGELGHLRETFGLIDRLALSEDVCARFRKAYDEYIKLLKTLIGGVYNSFVDKLQQEGRVLLDNGSVIKDISLPEKFTVFFQFFKDAIIEKNERHLLLSDEDLFSMGYSVEAYSIDDLMLGGLLPKNSIQVWQLISRSDSIKSKKIFHILEAGSLSYEPGFMIKNADFIGDETNELGSFLEIISRDYLLFLFNIFETSPDDFLKTAIALIKESKAFTESATLTNDGKKASANKESKALTGSATLTNDGKKASANKAKDEYFDFSDACYFLDNLMIIEEKLQELVFKNSHRHDLNNFKETDIKSYVQCLVLKTFMLYVAKDSIASDFEPCTIFSDLDKFDFSWKDFDSKKDEIFDFILKKSSGYLLKQNNNVERRDANALFINPLIQKKIDSFRNKFAGYTPSKDLKFSRKDQNYYDIFMTLVKKYKLLSKDSENSASRFKDESLGIFKDKGLSYKNFDTLFSNILADAKARVVDKASLVNFLSDTEALLEKWGLPSDEFLDYLVQNWEQKSSSDTQANISNKLFGENSPIVKNDGLSFVKNRPGMDSDSDDGFKAEMESAYSDFCRSVLLLAEGVLKNIENDFINRTGIFYDRRIAYYTIYHLGKNFDSFFSIIKEQNGICQSKCEAIFSNNIKLLQNLFVNDVGLRVDGLNTLFFAVLDASDFKELPYSPVMKLNLGIGQLALFRSLFRSCDEHGEENPQDMSIAACMELVSHSPFRMIISPVVEVAGTLPSVRLDYIANALKIHMPSFWEKISSYNLSFSKSEISRSILGISESHVRGSAPADEFLKKWRFNVNQIKTDKVDISVADLTTLSPYFSTQFRIRWVAKILEILLIEGEADLVDISIRQFPDLMDLMGQIFYKNEAWRGDNAQDYLEIFRKIGILKQRKKLRIAKN